MASSFASTELSIGLGSASRGGGQTSTPRMCRFFAAKGSCRAGAACTFSHGDDEPGGKAESSNSNLERRQAVTNPIASRVVSKPVSQAQSQNQREFQLGQIRRRFLPKESMQQDGSSLLKFSLAPSDPDFPFDISALECSLTVPVAYPTANPILKITNKDIPRGFALNIESGFAGLAEEKPDATILELVKALDRNLEIFLSAPKVDTIKLVPNKDTRHLSALSSRSVAPARDVLPSINKAESANSTKPTVSNPTINFTAQQKVEAAKIRETEVGQLEARMGRLPLYKKSADGIAYTLPIEPRKRADLPLALQAVKSIQLFVPLLYPLHACRIQLDGVDPLKSKPVEKGFELKASHQLQTTLMAHVNHLAQNMHILAKTTGTSEDPSVSAPPPQLDEEIKPIDKGKGSGSQEDPGRSHIQYITRPPEWAILSREDLSDTDSEDYPYDSGDESEDGDGGAELVLADEDKPSQLPDHNAERGTAISFPFIELYGVELLELITLNISVKCERCKDVTEIKGLRNGLTKSECCRKCASPLSVCFRRELVHAHAIRAGFLDLEGCFVADMLPSTFIPTCSQCSTEYPAPGIVSVQGETINNICRECHQKFTFKISQVKFLRISTSTHLPSTAQPRRRKETLGLTPGTELPKRGRCRHYTKSYRWFRFSCCQKVYACDKCHDAEEEHVNEWANRMICGWCSREGNYRPEDCAFCHGVLIGKKGGGGFWEGGKGTRDRVRMSKKDKRKFKKPGGGVKKT